MKAIPEWCKRYELQGYYSTSDRQRISLEDLPYCLEIVLADKVIMTCC